MDTLNELAKDGRVHIEKFVYFQLGASGACIAFAMTLTETIPLQFPHVLILFALVCWGGSFVAGTRALNRLGKIIQANYMYLKVGAETPYQLQHLFREFSHESQFTPHNQWLQFWLRAQTFLLVFGAAMIFVWRVWLAYQK